MALAENKTMPTIAIMVAEFFNFEKSMGKCIAMRISKNNGDFKITMLKES